MASATAWKSTQPGSRCLAGTETIASVIFLRDSDLKSTFIVVPFAMAFDADHVIIALLDTVWSSTPLYMVEFIVAVNAGAKGLVTWDVPTTQGVMDDSLKFSNALPEFLPLSLSSPLPSPPINRCTSSRGTGWVLACGFSDGQICQALILAANMNFYFPASIDLGDVLSATPFQSLS